MRKIIIKFTISKGFVSTILFRLFRHKYTHAAIALTMQQDEFYSFAFKGFSIEHKRHRLPTCWKENYAYYYLTVDEHRYAKLKELLEPFKNGETKYKYSCIALVCAFFKIPYTIKDCYYCSYFVAELLVSAGIHTFDKAPSLYLPHHLAKALSTFPHVEYTSKI